MQICMHEMSLEDLRRVCSEYELKRSAVLDSAALTAYLSAFLSKRLQLPCCQVASPFAEWIFF